MIIQQMAGFLLQTVPIAMLVLMAFNEEEYRLGRKRTAIYMNLFLLLYGLIFSVIHVLYYSLERNRLVMEAMMITAILFAIVMCFYLIKAAKQIMGMVFIICIHYASILYYLNNFFLKALEELKVIKHLETVPYPLEGIFTMLGALLFTYPFFCRLMTRHIRRALGKMEENAPKMEVVSIFSCFCVYLAACFCLSFVERGLLSFLIDIGLSYLSVLAYYMLFREISSLQERNRIKEQLLLYDMEYHRITENIRTAKHIRHDIRQHLNTISVLNSQGKREEIAEYLKNYHAVYDGHNERNYTDDPKLNSILAYYAALCEEKRIRTDIEIRLEDTGIFNPLDMTVVLGNCLENALYSLEMVPLEERWVKVRIGRTGGALLIIVENRCMEVSCEKQGEYSNWKNFHSLRNSPMGGIGLRSISDIAEKYGGIAQFQYKDGFFSSRIMLNVF